MVFEFFGKKKKVVIAMAHLGALPGSPLYDAKRGLTKIIDDAAADIEKLQAGGIDAIMFGNENDRPYVFKAPVEATAAFAAIVQALKPVLKMPFGVNYLWDPVASVAIGAVTGASFVREIFTGLFASDMGLWQPDCANALRLRTRLGRPDMKVLFNINAEFAYSLDQRPIELRAKSAVFSSLADAILVSGPLTGQPAEQSDLRKVARHREGRPGLRQHRRQHRQCEGRPERRRRHHHRHPSQGRRQYLEQGRWRAREAVHGGGGEAALMGYRIDPDTDRAFIEEFRQEPIGHHSPGLQRILNAMRYDPSGRQVILVCRKPFQEWVLGEMPPARDDPCEVESEPVFTSREEAEWEVFRRRWKAIPVRTSISPIARATDAEDPRLSRSL